MVVAMAGIMRPHAAMGAIITTYTSLAAYETALGASTVAETFNNGHLNGTLISSVDGSAIYSANRLYGVAGDPGNPSQFTAFNLSQPITSFAFDFGELDIQPTLHLPEKARVFLYGGPIHQAEISITAFPNGFFGLSSDTAFTRIVLSDATANVEPEFNTEFWLDNFRISTVPEPRSWCLWVIGLLGLGVGRRWGIFN